MFCDLSYPQDKGALEGPEKNGETIFQRIRQRQGCEEKQAICLYIIGGRSLIFSISFKLIEDTTHVVFNNLFQRQDFGKERKCTNSIF